MFPSLDVSAAVLAGRLTVDVDLRAGRVTLAGALTGSDCHHLDDAWSALCGGPHPTWLLDLSGLTGCDAAGVRALREAPRTAAGAGAVLIISTAQPGLRRLLAVAGLGGLLAPRATGRDEELTGTSGLAVVHQDDCTADSGIGRCGSHPTLSPASGPEARGAHDPHPHPTTPELIQLAVVGQQLIDRDCTADLADVGIADETDIRLLVGRRNGPVSVELLGRCDGAHRRDRWCAVRIDSDGIPCVWAGPTRACPTDALVAFVEALLGSTPRQLAGRYLPIG